MRANIVRIATVVLSGLGLPLLAAAPALARVDDGETPLHTSLLYTLLVYVAIPIGAFLVITLLTYGPSMMRHPRYRPTRAWDYDAVWFNGPDDPAKAINSTSAIMVKGGGASASW